MMKPGACNASLAAYEWRLAFWRRAMRQHMTTSGSGLSGHIFGPQDMPCRLTEWLADLLVCRVAAVFCVETELLDAFFCLAFPLFGLA